MQGDRRTSSTADFQVYFCFELRGAVNHYVIYSARKMRLGERTGASGMMREYGDHVAEYTLTTLKLSIRVNKSVNSERRRVKKSDRICSKAL